MFNFDFLEKGLGIISPPHSVYHFFQKKSFFFQQKCFSSYIVLANQISLSDYLGEYVYRN